MTHICVSDLTIIGSDIGLSPSRRQGIIRTNAGILLIRPLGTNFSEFLVEILIFSFKKMRLKVSSAKRRPFCLGLNELINVASQFMRSKVLSNERRHYIRDVFSHWLRTCTPWSKPGSVHPSFQIASSLAPTEVKPGVAIATITGELVGRDNKYTLQVNRVGVGRDFMVDIIVGSKRSHITLVHLYDLCCTEKQAWEFSKFFLISRIFRNPEIITIFFHNRNKNILNIVSWF